MVVGRLQYVPIEELVSLRSLRRHRQAPIRKLVDAGTRDSTESAQADGKKHEVFPPARPVLRILSESAGQYQCLAFSLQLYHEPTAGSN